MPIAPSVFKAYLAQLTPMENIVLNIAKSHLESSFSLEQSIGFQTWLKTQQQQATAAPVPAMPAPVPAAPVPAPAAPVKKTIRVKKV
jgi:hypothetical protein